MENHKKPLVLVVDDIPENLRVARDSLFPEFDFRSASSGEDALARVATIWPQLILMDVKMPGIDGFETCRRLKANPVLSPIPVIFMTALDDLDSKVQGFSAGGVDYVTKPFQQEELLARVRAHVRLFQLTEHLELLVDLRTKELSAANQRLRDADKQKADFLAGVANELKEPLDIIMGLLRGSNFLDRDGLQTIYGQANRLRQLSENVGALTDLLTVPESGRPTEYKPVSLNAIAHTAAETFRASAQARKIGLTERLASGDITVKGDEIQLGLALRHVIENAIQYTLPSGWVRVETRFKDEYAYLVVSDNGMGIPPNDLSHIFERFYRAQNSRIIAGSGLGLPIAKQIIERHGGNIGVESSLATGTVITIRLRLSNGTDGQEG
jgi:signal transduction histidine kinase